MTKIYNLIKRVAKWYFKHSAESVYIFPTGMIPTRD